MHVAIVYSLPTSRIKHSSYLATDEDTELSAREVERALQEKHVDVTMHPISDRMIDKIQNIHVNCIFNLIEWTGKDLPYAIRAFRLLEKTGIPFTGATARNYHTMSDKRFMKRAFDVHNIPTAKWQLFSTGKEKIRKDFTYPLIVKTSLEHCSIGLSRSSVVYTERELRRAIKQQITRFRQSVFAEEFIEGRELHLTVLEKHGELVVLPAAEVQFDEHGTQALLTYESRWNEKHPDYKLSRVALADVSDELHKKLETLGKYIFRVLKFRDYIRIDLRVRENGEIIVLEANANPGLGDSDEYTMTVSYKADNLQFADVVQGIVQSSLDRWEQAREKRRKLDARRGNSTRTGSRDSAQKIPLVQYVV